MCIKARVMKRWILGLAAVLLAGCAGSGYRYHDAGYWSGDRNVHGSVTFSAGTGFCAPWYGPFSYGPLWQSGYGCGPNFALGGFYGHGHLGWYDPYWRYYRYWRQPQGWQTRDPSARDQASSLSQQLDSRPPASFNSYESLGPLRARSLGPGGGGGGMPARSYRSDRGGESYQGYTGGLSGGRSGNSGLSGAVRSSGGNGAPRGGMSSNFNSAPRPAPTPRAEISPSRVRDSEE